MTENKSWSLVQRQIVQKVRQKIRQKFSVIITNTSDDIKRNSSFWHFNTRFVLKRKNVCYDY